MPDDLDPRPATPLDTTPLFATVPAEVRARLEATCERHHVAGGDLVFRQGATADSARNASSIRCGPRATVGEQGLLLDEPRSATVVAHLDRRGLLGTRDDDLDLSGEGDPECNLATSAVSGQSPPAGPQWSGGLRPRRLRALTYDKPFCASLDGFTLHAATRAGGLDAEGREALLRYVLRPPIAQERVEQQPNGRVRLTLKKAYAEREASPLGGGESLALGHGTVAVDMDPLSLLCRLATSVPLPRFHTIHWPRCRSTA